MAPIKFEENIKDKLEKRTLSPSSESWSKLSDRLDAEESHSKKSTVWWWSVAAGLLLMVSIGVPLFNADETKHVVPQVVEDHMTEELLNQEFLGSHQKEAVEVANEDKSQGEKEVVLPIENDSKALHSDVIKAKFESQNQLVNKTLPVEKKSRLNSEEQLNKDVQNLLDEAVMEIAVSEAMSALKSENNTVSDQEIDSLLTLASKELLMENLQKESEKTVDANALLMSVEDEMGQSFRSRVFEALKESYETVKIKVANRNN